MSFRVWSSDHPNEHPWEERTQYQDRLTGKFQLGIVLCLYMFLGSRVCLKYIKA